MHALMLSFHISQYIVKRLLRKRTFNATLQRGKSAAFLGLIISHYHAAWRRCCHWIWTGIRGWYCFTGRATIFGRPGERYWRKRHRGFMWTLFTVVFGCILYKSCLRARIFELEREKQMLDYHKKTKPKKTPTTTKPPLHFILSSSISRTTYFDTRSNFFNRNCSVRFIPMLYIH